VEEEVIKFEKWLRTLEVVPTIKSLKEKVEAIRKTELKKSLAGQGDFTFSQTRVIEKLTASIAEKIINDPILFLKEKADRPSKNTYLDIARKLFNLDSTNEQEGR